MVKEVDFEAFYEATGRANAAWQKLEDGVCDVFIRIVMCGTAGSMLGGNPKSHFLLGSIFYSSTNLRMRLEMISTALEITVEDQEIHKEWKTLRNKVNDLYKRRNVLAHGHVWGNSDNGASHISSSIFNFNSRRALNYEQVCASERAFLKQADRAGQFAQKVNKHLVGEGGAYIEG